MTQVADPLDVYYMSCAIGASSLSKARRTKVGAVLVTENGVIIPSWNGLPKPLGNILEDTVANELVTKPEVIHAEEACLAKCAKEGICIKNCCIYVTLSPCRHCASLIALSGIKRLVYAEQYRDISGLHILSSCGVEVTRYGQ